MASAQNNWYYIELTKRKGPYGPGDMQRLRAEGRIAANTLVRTPTMNEWEPYTRHFNQNPRILSVEITSDRRSTKQVAHIHIAKQVAEDDGPRTPCAQCGNEWPRKHLFVGEKLTVCLPCKARMEQATARSVKVTLPWHRSVFARIMLALLVISSLALAILYTA